MNKMGGGYLLLFPFFSWALLLLVVSYINDIRPNPRMKKIERILERGINRKKRELKYRLQNECVMSIGFVLYTFILSILATDYARNTEDHLHEEVSQYFFFHEDNVGLRLIYSLSFVPLVQDGVIMVSMILSILLSPAPWMVIGIVGFMIIISSAIIVPILILKMSAYFELFLLILPASVVYFYLIIDRCKSIWEDSQRRRWRFCAYSSFFPLACLINHLNYIIIAFTFNLYHATSIALIYGVVGIFIYVMLDRLPYLLQFFLKLCKNNAEYEDKAWYLIVLFITKAGVVIVLGLYVVSDGLVYYFVPIDNSFDIAGHIIPSNNILTNLLIFLYFVSSFREDTDRRLITSLDEDICYQGC